MQRLIKFDFSNDLESEQELIVSLCSLSASKKMSDGNVIDEGVKLMVLSVEGVDHQVETLYPDGEPAGVVFWVNPNEFDFVENVNKKFTPQDLRKIKGKVLGDWI